jgi:hypothetical protein
MPEKERKLSEVMKEMSETDERQLYFPPGDNQISRLDLSPSRVNDH